MANTGHNKKLASFNCDSELWGEFMRRCQEQGTTATATLTRFIELYLDGELEHLNTDTWDERFDNRVKACVDQYLEQRLPSYLDNYQANYQGKKTLTLTNPSSSRHVSTQGHTLAQAQKPQTVIKQELEASGL